MAPSTLGNMMRGRSTPPIGSYYSRGPDDDCDLHLLKSFVRRARRPCRFDEETNNITGGADEEQDQTAPRRYHLRKRTTQPKNENGNDGSSKQVTFGSIGGHAQHIHALQQMVFLPLMHPEFFSNQNIKIPRGVLFCGPPGTGKTLMARALANEASMLKNHKVSFYMRNSSDVLSKWMGESERELKLLFDQAKENQPSIIFFDEIDGLAPPRSTKQEQGHISIVATLLALMDGLESRGQVVVIGATNRVDAIDAALRRPGRFDREFQFTLPGCETRADILDIHTRKWNYPPSKELISELAARCVGYCGADLEALCTEASLAAFHDRYPQVYMSNEFDIDVNLVRVEKRHFDKAMSGITPAAHRGGVVHSRPLSSVVAPCLQRHLKTAIEYISDNFLIHSAIPHVVCRPWLYLYAAEGSGLNDLGPAVLHELGEKFPVHSLGFASLVSNPNGKTPEETLVHKVDEARRTAPSILYCPHFEQWWNAANEQLHAILMTSLLDFPSDLPVLLLVTSSVPPAEVGATISAIISECHVQNVVMCVEDIALFFDHLIKAALDLGQCPAGSQDRIKRLKQCFVQQTTKFSIRQFQRLYADIMKAILKIKDDRSSILIYLSEFAKNKANFEKIICNQ